MAAGEWERVRRRRRHCQWRQRKSRWGEMIQVDGSHHAWFEDRGSACVLMAYIDDATNRVYARFYEYEGTLPAMDSFRRYIRRHGLPQSLYLDRHSTYKSGAEPTPEERLEGRRPQSQFERAMRDLGGRGDPCPHAAGEGPSRALVPNIKIAWSRRCGSRGSGRCAKPTNGPRLPARIQSALRAAGAGNRGSPPADPDRRQPRLGTLDSEPACGPQRRTSC